MFAKLNRLSLIAALSIVAGTSAAAHAGPTAAESMFSSPGTRTALAFPSGTSAAAP